MNQALFDAAIAVKPEPKTEFQPVEEKAVSERPQVVIMGGGFGGLCAAKALAKAPVEVTLIDRHNYHLFQPLLYQVATAALTHAEIASPIRGILRKQKNTTVYLNTVVGIDKERRLVYTESGCTFLYDYLVLATGAQHSYFGNDQWAEFAPGLKTIDDAMELRRRILIAFEHAEMETRDQEKRSAYLIFIIVGGGPTGVEMAGAIVELTHSIAHDFRNVSTHCARILLVEAGDRILPQFDPMLSARAKRDLESLEVEVLVNTKVEEVGQGFAMLSGTQVRAETILWAAGVKASPAGEWLGVETDRTGRVRVDYDLSVPSHEEIFVIGDAAAFVPIGSDRPLPGLAPVAKQQGYYVGNLITQWVSKGRSLPPFKYKDYGTMATIGRNRGIADLMKLRLTGLIGWLSWGLVHVYFLIGFKNRLIVGLRWLWAYLTYQRGVRLITGEKSQI